MNIAKDQNMYQLKMNSHLPKYVATGQPRPPAPTISTHESRKYSCPEKCQRTKQNASKPVTPISDTNSCRL
jgi:hypothetical protein